jgi:hypothetical protein
MSYGTDSKRTDLEETPNPRSAPTERPRPTGWLDALNAFLDRVYLQADRDTGC